MTTVLDADRRASLIAAARGEHQPTTAPVPCGIRVVNPPTQTARAASTATAPTPAAAKVTESPESPALESPLPADVEDLLGRAEASPRQRTRTLGARLRHMLTDLQGQLDIEAAESEALTRVAELRRQLAEAEEQLRKARRSDAAPAATSETGSGVDPRAVRAWAAANGVECNTTGRVPNAVVAAWRAATGRPS